MKILLNWVRKPQDPDLAPVFSALAAHGHRVIYWVGSDLAEKIFPEGAVFHSYRDALEARPAPGIDAFAFQPPSEDLLNKLSRAESIVLTMMNLGFDRACVDKRKDIYYEMVRYWHGVLTTHAPDAVVFPNMPHHIYDYVLYELAKLLHVRTALFDDTRFPGRLLPFTDFDRLTALVQEEMHKSRGKTFSLNELSPDILSYYEPRARRDYRAVPSYITDLKRKRSFHWSFPWAKARAALRDGSAFRKAGPYARWMLRIKGGELARRLYTHVSYPGVPDLRKEYESVASLPDFARDFVYFPLQKQPERSTSPQCGVFVDQILALRTLSAALPKGWIVYTKEHPVQWVHFGIRFSSFRYRGYYDTIARIPNVRVVPHRTSSYELINRARCVSAVTGSAGWEAALRGTPSVIFGTVWYQDCPGVRKAGSVNDCHRAFDAIRSGFSPDRQALTDYLASFDRATFRAFISPSAGKASTVGRDECMQNIGAAIVRLLARS